MKEYPTVEVYTMGVSKREIVEINFGKRIEALSREKAMGLADEIIHALVTDEESYQKAMGNGRADKYLTSAMDNVLAHRLGIIARSPQLHDPINIGDEIDRGLILRRLLEQSGFGLVKLEKASTSTRLTQLAPDSLKAAVLSLPESVLVENALPAESG